MVASDERLQEAIRRNLEDARRLARQGRSRVDPDAAKALAVFTERRGKLLELHYADKISADLFAEEERKLAQSIEQAEAQLAEAKADDELEDLSERFEAVVAVLQELDVDRVWEAATEQQRRVLIDELVEGVSIFPDHLEVAVHGVPRLNVLLSEVGLAQSQNAGVGGGT
ncbi:MAG: hypothetical protein JJE46_01930 [Acidimicrobiia bacterium]|nr:hypothetical protein [Acidimicrobiia bacterium]